MKLYGFPPSPNTWKVRALAAHLGIKLDEEFVVSENAWLRARKNEEFSRASDCNATVECTRCTHTGLCAGPSKVEIKSGGWVRRCCK